LLSRALDANNAEWTEIGERTQRQMEQDEANRKLADEQAKVQREAEKRAEERRRQERDCARERAANGGTANWVFSSCSGL